MGSLSNPKTKVPYINTKDCSQGFCSFNCPQWCYFIFPPPPPLELPDEGSASFSPLVLAIIGILVSAFLLSSYYAIISTCRGNLGSSSRRENEELPHESDEEEHGDPLAHEPWHVVTTGLDEALIRSIAVCKYKRGDGLIEGTDCPVCLSEFLDDENLRLLPKCSHAFHVNCIDTWLKSHSNCPLCRANIISVTSSPPHLPPQALTDPPPNNESLSSENLYEENINGIQETEVETITREDETPNRFTFPKSSIRALSDLGGLERLDTIIEIRDEEDEQKHVRRSVSMDYYSCKSRISMADMLRMNQDDDEEFRVEECRLEKDIAGTSKRAEAQMSKKCSYGSSRVLHCVMSTVAMKRSFSSGRFLCTRHGRAQNIIIPF